IALSPTADLVPAEITAPTTGVIGRQVAVSWKVTNEGPAATLATQWDDKVYLSTDGTLAGAHLLGTFRHTGFLTSTSDYVRTENVTLPVVPSADYYLVVVTDAASEVFERAGETNNQ